MRRTFDRLSTRLLLSHLAVALVGAGVAFGLVRLLAPTDFARRTGSASPGAGRGRALLEAFDAAIDQALLIGLLAALVVATVLAWLTVHRLLRPLDRVRTATRALAGGDFRSRVEVPNEVELAALAHDINALGAALEESETRRVRLIGEVAHEMRTPLTVIDGNVEAMIDGIFQPTPQRLAALSEETRVLRRLAEDLSTLSRAEEGRLSLTIAPLDLAALAAEEADRLRGQYAAAEVALDVTAGPAVRVRADADRLRQVLSNLLGNALRACAPGDRVRVEMAYVGDTAVLTVADTGRGIAADNLERVFERFYRVPDPVSGIRPGTGSGIGLTIARSIARAHGGELTASSPGPGGGAIFRLVLPTA